MRMILRILAFVMLSGLFCCKTNQLTHIKLTDAYNPDADFFRLQCFAYHINDSITRVYYRFNTEYLLYSKDLNQTPYKAEFSLHYQLTNSDSPKEISDSATISYSDTLGYGKKIWLLDSFDLKIPFPSKYYLYLRMTDLNRKASNSSGFYLEKSSHDSRQHFMMRGTDGRPVFTDSWDDMGTFSLHCIQKQHPRLFVRYYRRDFPIALPPFVESKPRSLSFAPDSVFFIEMNNGRSGDLTFAKAGIYHIQTDTSDYEGFTVFRFYRDYPLITSADQMRSPLRYITSKNEFNDLMMMKSAKDAVDEFWLDKTDNPDRAREMIRKYYNRVAEANRYFTSYHEGWKTDRGLIYIIFGPPTLVYRNPGDETWIYGEDRNLLSITFVFDKMDNPFTDNDYALNRSQEYKDIWYSTLETWRN